MITLTHFFSNKHGKIVIWQKPNLPLWIWIVTKLVTLPVDDGKLKSGLGDLSRAAIFTWAFLELTDGDSYFRKFLGLVVITVTTISFF